MDPLVDALLTSLCGVGTLLLLNILGVILATFPKEDPVLTRSKVKALAGLTINFILPCLTWASTSKLFTAEKVFNSWILFVAGIVFQFVGLVISTLYVRLFSIPKSFDFEFILCSSFPNSFALPFILSAIFCRQDFLSEVEECEEEAAAYIFIYLTGWHLLFWPFVYIFLDRHGNSEELTCKSLISKIFFRPVMLSLLLGTAMGLVAPIRHFFWETRGGKVLSSTFDIIGRGGATMATIVMTGSLGNAFLEWYKKQYPDDFHEFEMNGKKEVEMKSIKQEEPPNLEEIHISPWTHVHLVLIRMFTVPLINFCLVLSILPIVPHDKMLRMILFLQCIPPSANMTVVISQKLGHTRAAETIATNLMFQYLASIITITVFITWMLNIVFY